MVVKLSLEDFKNDPAGDFFDKWFQDQLDSEEFDEIEEATTNFFSENYFHNLSVLIELSKQSNPENRSKIISKLMGMIDFSASDVRKDNFILFQETLIQIDKMNKSNDINNYEFLEIYSSLIVSTSHKINPEEFNENFELTINSLIFILSFGKSESQKDACLVISKLKQNSETLLKLFVPKLLKILLPLTKEKIKDSEIIGDLMVALDFFSIMTESEIELFLSEYWEIFELILENIQNISPSSMESSLGTIDNFLLNYSQISLVHIEHLLNLLKSFTHEINKVKINTKNECPAKRKLENEDNNNNNKEEDEDGDEFDDELDEENNEEDSLECQMYQNVLEVYTALFQTVRIFLTYFIFLDQHS